MKQTVLMVASLFALAVNLTAQDSEVSGKESKKNLYLDIHYLPAGSVKFKDVAAAHQKDLVVQKSFGVDFLKYWVDEKKGIVYCLSSAPDSMSIAETHKKAHGLLPARVMSVSDGITAKTLNRQHYFLDVHQLGAGKVTAKDVAAAHEKDLAVQRKYGVNFINYWVNEKEGVVVCLSQAENPSGITNTHREAHGLLPDQILPVKQGQ